MPKRYKMKVEVEFECPATVPPGEAFYRYFDVNRKVDNDKVKVLESTVFTTPSKANMKTRAHNEARRVLQTILSSISSPIEINSGYRSTYGNGASTFQVTCSDPKCVSNYGSGRQWFVIEGSMFKHNDRTVNLADPSSIEAAAKLVECAFGLCTHRNGRHV